MRVFKKLLISCHRYIGIPLSFMFVVWFVSAFFMIYTGGMPRITPDMQIDGAAPLALGKVAITPGQAAEIAGFEPDSATLRTIIDRPVYQLGFAGGAAAYIYADTGEFLPYLNENQAAQVASSFLDIPVGQFSFVGELEEVDQWTLTESRQLPFMKFTADDGLGTEVYVSPDTGRVVSYTTTWSRALAWLGTIPHWLYIADLRLNQPLWYKVVVWLSYTGCALAFLGLCLGFTQYRRNIRPFSLKRAIPYHGMMRWHYILGVVFGVFTLTWVFSGLVSMEPWAWTSVRGLAIDGQVYQQGDMKMADFPPVNALPEQTFGGQEVKELEFHWIQGQPWLLANYSIPQVPGTEKRDRLHQPYNINGQSESRSLLVNAVTLQQSTGFDPQLLTEQLDASVADYEVTEFAVLDDYDDYYYSRQSQLPLPVLRIKFNDPDESWIYVDPHKSQLLSLIHKYSRVERWLYNGLHSLDFAFWYHKRPLWDIGVITLLLGGLAVSLIGLYFGLRRLKYDLIGLYRRFNSVKPAAGAAHVTH
jgi:hypothetical protein